ncbi:hypothetical protein [Arthrobacter sp. ZBG10]|nr:hypothetical protein [Arthrobacter sp. ZBG10]
MPNNLASPESLHGWFSRTGATAIGHALVRGSMGYPLPEWGPS